MACSSVKILDEVGANKTLLPGRIGSFPVGHLWSTDKRFSIVVCLLRNWTSPVASTWFQVSSTLDMILAIVVHALKGLGHCSGGPGAINFGSGSQSLSPVGSGQALKDDASHDMVLALFNWVEHDQAPEEIIAAAYVNDTRSLGGRQYIQLLPCMQADSASFSQSLSLDLYAITLGRPYTRAKGQMRRRPAVSTASDLRLWL